MAAGVSTGLWVFGYGSLCWNPGFEFEKSCIGFIRGYKRRFSQGNTFHRGTHEKPGRVATLIEDKDGTVWGRAFLITGEAALNYLAERECKIGGYKTIFAPVFSMKESSNPEFTEIDDFVEMDFALNLWRSDENDNKRKRTLSLDSEEEIRPSTSNDNNNLPRLCTKMGLNDNDFEQVTQAAIVYIATPDNEHWMGDAKVPTLAHQICSTSGQNGHNIDYVLNLAKFVRENCPFEADYHLFELEQEILKISPEHECAFYEKLDVQTVRQNEAAAVLVQQQQDSN
ncbi:hypothetical protein B566_EDAN012661 [Ephemera danica]|nr:hypothetical protein B566_EDAN012661 [Ephemera danica]